MERNYLSNSLKGHGIRSRSYNHNNNLPVSSNSKLKDSWNHISQSYGGGGDQDCLGGVGGFSWPPRSYTCSFCKREFRSAQALGGHMNVHRRDRARLRQSPPTMDIGQCPINTSTTTLNLNLCPDNFNPNPSNSMINASPPLICTTLSSLVSSSSPLSALSSSSPSFASPSEERKWVSNIDGTSLLDPLSPRSNSDFGQMVTRKSRFEEENLDGFKYEGACKFFNKGEFVRLDLDLEIGALSDHTKEELDLELRLGCS